MPNAKFLILNSLALCVAACGAAAPPVTYPVMPSALTPIGADHDNAKDFARGSREALRLLAAPRTKVAALVTVAGAVGGSWLPDEIRVLMQGSQPWIASGCPGNVQDGLHSLTRELRLRFLRENPLPVAGYSIVAASAHDETSSILRVMWKQLSIYAKEQDSQLVAWEAVLPGGKYLGAARADHWAIAMPFEESSQPPKAVDRNHFPRDALLEAIVRFVTADLGSS